MINATLRGSHSGGLGKSQPVCQKEKHVDISRYSMEWKSTVMGFRCRSDFCTAGTDYQRLQVRPRYGKEFHRIWYRFYLGVWWCFVLFVWVSDGTSKIFTTSKNSSCALFRSLVQAGRMFAFKIFIFLGTVLTHQFRDTVWITRQYLRVCYLFLGLAQKRTL